MRLVDLVKAPDRLAAFVQETTQTVYNWQFMHSVSLWTRMIGELHDDESIQSLIYPLTQTIIGTIKFVVLLVFISQLLTRFQNSALVDGIWKTLIDANHQHDSCNID